MISSTDTSLIIPALVKALGEMEDIPKTRTADMGKYKYTFADLKDVLSYLRPLLAKHDLGVMQTAMTLDGTAVTTTILHGSGQWIETPPLRMPAGSDAQSHGSAITFSRRYSLLAFLGLATEDDDGAAASQRPPQARTQPAATRTAKKPGAPSEAVTKRVMAMFKEADITDRDERLKVTAYIIKRDITSWSDVNSKEADEVIGTLDNLIKGRVRVGYEDDGSIALKAAS